MNKLYEKYLTIVARCYKTGDFRPMYPLLAKDVIWESYSVMEPRKGYDTVVNYYEQKGKTLRESPWKSKHTLVKTLEPSRNPFEGGIKAGNSIIMLFYEKDKLLDYAVQISDTGERFEILIEIKINKDKLISRINMCNPNLYRFAKYKDLF